MVKNHNRRQFFKQSALGVFALNSLNVENEKKNKSAEGNNTNRIIRYNTLGRTGFKVSDIAFGAPDNPAVVKAAIDLGVNYLDTGEIYGNGNGERTIAKAIKGRDRKSLFITTKLQIKKAESKESILRRARKCLERLDSEYIDCLMIHNAYDVKLINHIGFHQATRQLKREGKLRFIGITSHGTSWWKNDKKLMTETMEKVCLAAARDGRFDVFLFIYNFMNTEMGERILAACKEKNIGTTLMKINPIHNYTLLLQELAELRKKNKELPPRAKQVKAEFEDMVNRAQNYIQKNKLNNPKEISASALRFVLKNPDVHTVCCQMPNFDEMEHWLSLSGSGFLNIDKKKLAIYKKSFGQFYCRHACGICEKNCPQKIPVNTIMRYHHYFDGQKREKEAMVLYSKLASPWNQACQQCAGHCQKNCPFNVPIQSLLEIAHNRLSLA